MGLGRELEPVGDAVDVRVDRDSLNDAKAHIEHDVGCLSPHTRELDELFHIGRNVAAVIGNDHLSSLNAVLGLRFIEAERLDHLGDLYGCGTSHGLGSGPAAEKLRRNFVHLRIGGLGRKEDRNDEAEGVLVVEKALDGAVAPIKPFTDLNCALALGGVGFTGHGESSLRHCLTCKASCSAKL